MKILYRGVFVEKSENGPRIDGFGGLDRENRECQSSDPPSKSNYTETRYPVQKVRRHSKLCSLERGKKSYKKERKKKEPTFEHNISPFTGPALRGRLLPFLQCGVPPPT